MKNVLLIDDDPICNFISGRILNMIGGFGEIKTATNGLSAIDLLKNHYGSMNFQPDVILLDLNMPVMDGFTFLSEFKTLEVPQKENIKIIIVTSSDSPSDIKRARDMGITRYIYKPLSQEKLQRICNEEARDPS